jgi:hypothetical protein
VSRFTLLIASKHDPHTPRCPGAARVPGMVSRQLLPHGFRGFAHRDYVRGKAGNGLDDWMIVQGVCPALWQHRDRIHGEPRRILVILTLYISIFNKHGQELSPSDVHVITSYNSLHPTLRFVKVRGSGSWSPGVSSSSSRRSPEDEGDAGRFRAVSSPHEFVSMSLRSIVISRVIRASRS